MARRDRPLNWRSVCRALLGIGLIWLMVGMALMPSAISFNPGRGFQRSLFVLLYLPSLILVLADRAQVWRRAWQQPVFKIYLLLCAWALLTLVWGKAERPGNEIGRLCTVTLFILGWRAWAGQSGVAEKRLLLLSGLLIGGCALFYSIRFILGMPHAGEGARIAAAGVVGTPNYAAAYMGVACLWLAQVPLGRKGGVWQWLRGIAVAALLVFIALTQSRSIWAALLASVLLAPLWTPGRRSRWVALTAAVLVVPASLAALPILLQRGVSFRPQIFQQAMSLVGHHPLGGQGLGSDFLLHVGRESFTHSHNLFTQAAIQLGLPGLTLLVSLWVAVTWQGWRHRRDWRGRLMLSLWLFATVALQFDMPQLLDSPRPGWLLIWLPVALALGLVDRSRPPDWSRRDVQ
ncbi:O-antigen ligase family protein [Pseudoxanthomonas sp. JBR18]|uniref:O-antigen ligase family protein n=1 Tax=Pseudoxanthomonas sp. JBR18 TaxID=2969308 RepID=UPI0023064BEA|nr:O-antigen ligase family protein [Pseudoxanthomonas sp. JBR18]WCE03713.1 O-antigen ligase family protein [Pseudoxanthomonas sp. JBR18]